MSERSELVEQLYARYDEFVKYGVRLTGNIEDARDLVQEAFLKVYSRPLRDERNLRSWMYTVIRNAWIDEVRKGRPCIPVMDAPAFQVPEEEHALAGSLEDALKSVDTECADMLYSQAVEGLQYADIAQRYNVPVGTVSSRLRRTKRKLRKILGDLV